MRRSRAGIRALTQASRRSFSREKTSGAIESFAMQSAQIDSDAAAHSRESSRIIKPFRGQIRQYSWSV